MIGDGVGVVGFEEGDVEDRMKETHSVRELESECMARDFMGDGERTETFVVKLLGRAFGRDVLSIQPDEVADFEVGSGESATVGRDLVLGLGDFDLVSAIGVEVGEGFGEVVGSRVGDRDIEREGGARIITIVGKERGDLSRRVRGIVVGELGDGEEVCPVVLLIVGVHPEVGLQCLVRALGLAVGLGVECSGEIQLHVQESAEGRHELGGECGTPIRDDIRGDTMLGEDVAYVEASDVGRRRGGGCGNEEGHFGESVHNDEDGVVGDSGIGGNGNGELTYEIDRDGLPGSFGDGELLEQPIGLVSRSFVAGTGVACATVVADHRAQARPIELLSH